MRISFDPEANAVYVSLTPTHDGWGEPEVIDNGVIVDVDGEGQPRGFEFLSVRQRGIPTDGLPFDVAQAVDSFVASGDLKSEIPISRDYPEGSERSSTI